ncbi:hypothetical protein N3K66_008307 [Trichothecium roseum]|uniref:Uncharacterized protein n=1 Tax=Trichothecium roseum TaxID=47278 RepID=A0ACC0UU79_9HYPO|nr:hypothetical protein N3K66_008307 [Trichothecium roseum]
MTEFHQRRELRKARVVARERKIQMDINKRINNESAKGFPTGCVPGYFTATAYEISEMAMTPESGNVMSMTEATAPQPVPPPPPPSSSSQAQPKKRSRPSAGRPRKPPAQRKSSSGRRLQPSQRVLENQSMENDDTIASVEHDSAPASSLPGPSQVIADEAQINPLPNADKERQGTRATGAVKPLIISPNISNKEHLQRVAASLFPQASSLPTSALDSNIPPIASRQSLPAARTTPADGQTQSSSTQNFIPAGTTAAAEAGATSLTINTAVAQALREDAGTRSRTHTPTPKHTPEMLGFPSRLRQTHIMATPPPAVEHAEYAWAADHAHFASQASRARYALRANHAMNPQSASVSPPGKPDVLVFERLREAHREQELMRSSAAEVGPVAQGARMAGVADEAIFAESADVADYILPMTA